MSHYSPIIALLISLSLTALTLYCPLGSKIQDTLNERFLHALPTPRVGGVRPMVGVSRAWACASDATKSDDTVCEHLHQWVSEYTPTSNGH